MSHRAAFILGVGGRVWLLLMEKRLKQTQLWNTESSLAPKLLHHSPRKGRRETRETGTLNTPSQTYHIGQGQIDMKNHMSTGLYSVQSACELAFLHPHGHSIMEKPLCPFYWRENEDTENWRDLSQIPHLKEPHFHAPRDVCLNLTSTFTPLPS